ncbi:MAG: aldo/keto reductase [Gemmatimonadaceae bacterium]|nr:aldo/keto reductase [Gemmatimonadaceae bacterium]
MRERGKADKQIAGCATQEGTERYRGRFGASRAQDFFRPLADVLSVSSIGLGTYLGDCDDKTDADYVATTMLALSSGINLLDSAINYRCQRSERALGSALRAAVGAGEIRRDEIVVCSKAGYIPLDGTPPPTRRDYDALLKAQYFDTGIVTPGQIVAGGHCIAPSYLSDQIQRSRRNLGVSTIDIYYLHNPEQQLDSLSRDEFATAIREAFSQLEREVADGNIGCYGCATWNGFRAKPGDKSHLAVTELLKIAEEVGGADHHFRVIQLPISLAMPEAVRIPTQPVGNTLVPLLQAANDLGMAVIASAPLMQGQLTHGLPAKLAEAFPLLTTDAQRAVAFVRSLPRVTAALVGMKRQPHLQEQLKAVER